MTSKGLTATRSDAFHAQKSLVLDMVRRHGLISRSELSKQLGLRSSTVSFHVSELIDCGILHEVGAKKTSMGRPALLLGLKANSLLAIGLLIRNTDISGVVSDLCGNILRTQNIPLSSEPDTTTIINSLVSLAKAMCSDYDPARILGIGLAVPGWVDVERGVWEEYAPMPQCRGAALGKVLSDTTEHLVVLENDTRARALTEKWLASDRDFRDLLFVDIGEGVSSALVIGSAMWRGTTNTAGEIGHISIHPDGPPCYCGGRGCLEHEVTRAALFKRVRQHLARGVTSELNDVVESNDDELTITAIRQALDHGDKVAAAAVEDTCVPLGIGLANAINLMNPSHVIVGGALAALGEHLLTPLKRRVKMQAFQRAITATDIRLSEFAKQPLALCATSIVLEASFSATTTSIASVEKRLLSLQKTSCSLL